MNMPKTPVNNHPTTAARPVQGSLVSQYISFVMLIVTIAIFGFFFFHVIRGFLLPLFMAALLAVIFRPLHVWVTERFQRHTFLAATTSTSAIMLIVFAPVAGLVALGVSEANDMFQHRREIMDKAVQIRTSWGLEKPFANRLDAIEAELRRLDDAFNTVGGPFSGPDFLKEEVTDAQHVIEEQLNLLAADARETAIRMQSASEGDYPKSVQQYLPSFVEQLAPSSSSPSNSGAGDMNPTAGQPEQKAIAKSLQRGEPSSEFGFVHELNDILDRVGEISTDSRGRRALAEVQVAYNAFRTNLLGGPLWKWIVDLVSDRQIDDWFATAFQGSAARWLPSITNTATSLISNLLVGIAIMSVALFYFFLDGAKMIQTFMHLSPMDDAHELELVQEFDKVSRAVVLATLLSAVAQGVLGMIGYTIVGHQSIFLLTLLTTVLALIPFVGAAAVWVPCCLWLALIDENYVRAGFLAVYGFVVISMVDNFIKPWVLQGQSKLHPLLALLSVLGGVQALGPIGIVVGPMVISFLQVLLTILQGEILSLDVAIDANSRDINAQDANAKEKSIQVGSQQTAVANSDPDSESESTIS